MCTIICFGLGYGPVGLFGGKNNEKVREAGCNPVSAGRMLTVADVGYSCVELVFLGLQTIGNYGLEHASTIRDYVSRLAPLRRC